MASDPYKAVLKPKPKNRPYAAGKVTTAKSGKAKPSRKK